jgi:hypothetical protein
MIKDTISKIETKIKESEHITVENKTEYFSMLQNLKSEIETLAKTEKNQAESITGFTNMSVHEAVREDKNEQLLDISLEGLQKSIEGFEVSNPNLVAAVNSFCSLLSNLGI